MRPPSERPLVRLLAAALALGGLLTPLVAARHAAQSSHVACAEHGEMVEADAPRLAAVHSHATGSATLEREQPFPAQLHGHTHCALLAQVNQRALPGPGQGPGLASIIDVIEIAAPPDAPIAPAIALIHLAPKSSPPARG